jgi:hypothetical protein
MGATDDSLGREPGVFFAPKRSPGGAKELDTFLTPRRGWVFGPLIFFPRLAPWAIVLRPFGADVIDLANVRHQSGLSAALQEQ